jgi:DNA-binding winged helix-turn-helix (wHTH) protein/tetratricopeptide (TPR) repeat protein
MASSARPSSILRFGSFELDAANAELRKAGIPLKLHPQPLRVLLLLTAHPGQIVEREEIQHTLWGDNTFVDFEGGINFCIKQIRDTLGDAAEKPKYIETLPRRGYRFIAPVSHGELREHVILFPHTPVANDSVKTASRPVEKASPELDIHPVPSAQPGLNRDVVRFVVAALCLAMVFTAGTIFLLRRAPKLTSKDTVVLADFRNATGDAVFDDALKQALAVELGQSPFLNVLPDRKTGETLRMMGRSGNERVSGDVGREICLRTGSKAVLEGSIASLGSHYLVDLTAVACNGGETLAREQAEAARKEEVLKALSRASASLRAKLGESLPSVQKFDVPIEATTTSLEALKNYSMGAKVAGTEGDAASIVFLKRAIELDPNFAMAYAALAGRYNNLNQPSLAYEYAARAYELREHVTEREKLRISAAHFRATGDLEQLSQTFEVWRANYPNDSGPHGSLCANYGFIGQYEKALAECQEALRLDPDNGINYGNLSGVFLNLERLEEAKSTLDQAAAHKINGSALAPEFYSIAFLQGSSAEMAAQMSSAAGRPGIEDALLSAQSDTEAYFGRVRQAREFSRRAVDSAIRSGLQETAALWEVEAALRDAEFGENVEAKRSVADALRRAPGKNVMVLGAIALARIGETTKAKEMANRLRESYPSNTQLKIYWLPVIQATIELRGDFSQTLAALEPAAPYELAQPSPNQWGTLYPVYLRGQAYLLAHNGAAAAAEFQKVIDHSGIVVNFVTGALAHLELARAYVVAGEEEKARRAYQDFLTLWKDADRDNPLFLRAKTEYEKLH